MESLIIALTPVIVSAITWVVRKVEGKKLIPGAIKTPFWRLMVAIFSFVGVYAQTQLVGGEFDITQVDVLADAFINFAGATGVYFLANNGDWKKLFLQK